MSNKPVDYKVEAEELFEWMEDHGFLTNRDSIAFELLEAHIPELLQSFAAKVRNEAIEEHLRKLQAECAANRDDSVLWKAEECLRMGLDIADVLIEICKIRREIAKEFTEHMLFCPPRIFIDRKTI